MKIAYRKLDDVQRYFRDRVVCAVEQYAESGTFNDDLTPRADLIDLKNNGILPRVEYRASRCSDDVSAVDQLYDVFSALYPLFFEPRANLDD